MGVYYCMSCRWRFLGSQNNTTMYDLEWLLHSVDNRGGKEENGEIKFMR